MRLVAIPMFFIASGCWADDLRPDQEVTDFLGSESFSFNLKSSEVTKSEPKRIPKWAYECAQFLSGGVPEGQKNMPVEGRVFASAVCADRLMKMTADPDVNTVGFDLDYFRREDAAEQIERLWLIQSEEDERRREERERQRAEQERIAEKERRRARDEMRARNLALIAEAKEQLAAQSERIENRALVFDSICLEHQQLRKQRSDEGKKIPRQVRYFPDGCAKSYFRFARNEIKSFEKRISDYEDDTPDRREVVLYPFSYTEEKLVQHEAVIREDIALMRNM